MSNSDVSDLDEQLAAITKKVQRIVHEVEGLRDTNHYLSQRLTESHQMHGALIRQRDGAEVQYQVLRDLALQVVRTWDRAHVTLMDELNDEVQRFREVLGMTSEMQPLDKGGR